MALYPFQEVWDVVDPW